MPDEDFDDMGQSFLPPNSTPIQVASNEEETVDVHPSGSLGARPAMAAMTKSLRQFET